MALKVITPSTNTGFDPVGKDDYRAGMIATRATDGTIVLCGSSNDDTNLDVVSGITGNEPIGIFGEDRLTKLEQTTDQVKEEVTLVSGVAVALAHDDIVGKDATNNSLRLVLKSNNATVLVQGTAYDADLTAGTIKSKGTQADGTVALATYTFGLNDQLEKDFRGSNFKGSLDDTEGSKKATVWKGFGEFDTDQFVTDLAYVVGDALKCTLASHRMGAGLFVNASETANVGKARVGYVRKVPTASDPFLGVVVDIKLSQYA